MNSRSFDDTIRRIEALPDGTTLQPVLLDLALMLKQLNAEIEALRVSARLAPIHDRTRQAALGFLKEHPRNRR